MSWGELFNLRGFVMTAQAWLPDFVCKCEFPEGAIS